MGSNHIEFTIWTSLDLTLFKSHLKCLHLKGKNKSVPLLVLNVVNISQLLPVLMLPIGNYVPPALIISRKNYKAEYFDGIPPGSLDLCHPSGYMTGDLFFKWMRHFVAFVNASLANKVLLILDGHSSHKNLDALEFAKANGVVMLCFPPHCTHRMQPTDLSFFGPLQAYYDREMSTWIKNQTGRTIGLYQVAQLFGRAYEIAASVRNITSGFEKSGIYPFNPHIFPEELYLPSAVTENELTNEDEPVASSSSLYA